MKKLPPWTPRKNFLLQVFSFKNVIKCEPDVKTSLNEGADLVMFSGDKLLGGPQAGLVVGKKELVSRLKKAPMMRALRVGKLTLAALSSVIRSYFDDRTLVKTNPLFSILEQSHDDLMKKIHILYSQLTGARVKCGLMY